MRSRAAIRDERLLKWLRREVNRDLREWQFLRAGNPGEDLAGKLPGLIADCKAKLGLIKWAFSWQSVHKHQLGSPDYVQATMVAHLEMIMFAVRHIACGYEGRDGWRHEWASISAWIEAGISPYPSRE